MNKSQITNITTYSFFSGSIWDFKSFPDDDIATYFSKKSSIVDITAIEDMPLYDEIKDIYISCLTKQEPYSYKSKSFPYLAYLSDFMTSRCYTSFFEIADEDFATEEWLTYWTDKGKKYLHDATPVIQMCILGLLEYRDKRTGLERNLWKLSDMKLNDERICKSFGNSSLNFWKIKNSINRDLLKEWFKYQIGGTELAYRTIYERFSLMQMFCHQLKEKTFLQVTHDDVENFCSGFATDRHNHFINDLRMFYEYLSSKELFTGFIPVSETDIESYDYTYIRNTVPESVIYDIFGHLQDLPELYLLIFLINLFTGIRISDICQLKLGCIYKSAHGYFLQHSVQKMQNIGAIPISKELYNLISKRQKYIKSLDYEEEYLFPSLKKHNHPFQSSTYRKHMKDYMKAWNIKNANDDSIFNFVTHAFRHTISTELYRTGMPAALIQIGILHHQSIDMSRHYIELTPEYKLTSMKEHGLFRESTKALSAETNGDGALPNGFCGMPVSIHCPNMNACLSCEFFRTSTQFLDTHKQHLSNLNDKIDYYKKNGFDQNLAFALKEKVKLETIIATLTQMEGDGMHARASTKTK